MSFEDATPRAFWLRLHPRGPVALRSGPGQAGLSVVDPQLPVRLRLGSHWKSSTTMDWLAVSAQPKDLTSLCPVLELDNGDNSSHFRILQDSL